MCYYDRQPFNSVVVIPGDWLHNNYKEHETMKAIIERDNDDCVRGDANDYGMRSINAAWDGVICIGLKYSTRYHYHPEKGLKDVIEIVGGDPFQSDHCNYDTDTAVMKAIGRRLGKPVLATFDYEANGVHWKCASANPAFTQKIFDSFVNQQYNMDEGNWYQYRVYDGCEHCGELIDSGGGFLGLDHIRAVLSEEYPDADIEEKY